MYHYSELGLSTSDMPSKNNDRQLKVSSNAPGIH